MTFSLKIPFLGFEDIKTMELEKIDDVFARLTTNERDDATFTLINPFILRDYQFEIPTQIEQLLQLNDAKELRIYNTVVLNSKIEQSTINFAAPIIFNVTNKSMAQIILSDTNIYGIDEKLSSFLPKDPS